MQRDNHRVNSLPQQRLKPPRKHIEILKQFVLKDLQMHCGIGKIQKLEKVEKNCEYD